MGQHRGPTTNPGTATKPHLVLRLQWEIKASGKSFVIFLFRVNTFIKVTLYYNFLYIFCLNMRTYEPNK